MGLLRISKVCNLDNDNKTVSQVWTKTHRDRSTLPVPDLPASSQDRSQMSWFLYCDQASHFVSGLRRTSRPAQCLCAGARRRRRRPRGLHTSPVSLSAAGRTGRFSS
ncbi:unnamed protein product [Pleuronectes platessa]|uniref:Uncharacterized protein n=1 Tax=Pleuronectes platessa TaxID=8262 RepID=A0A9N7YEW6_PLEPL|nr:unnamed protein product [Pleuronectes platessa]